MARRTTTRPHRPQTDTPAPSTIRGGFAVIVGLAAFALVAAVLVLVFRGGDDAEQRALIDEPDRAEVADIGDVGTDGQGYEIVIPLDPDGDGNGYKLFAVRAHGEGVRKLLPGPVAGDPANETYPAWSPDGNTLAFASDRDGNDDIYFWHGSGEPYPITDHPNDDRHESSVTWHPNGRVLSIHHRSAVHFDRGGGRGQFSLDTMEFHESTTFGDALSHWSPDGSRIAGLAMGPIDNPPRRYTSTMWLTDGDGSDEMQISNFPANSLPDWSLDSSQFIFAGDNMVYVVNRDGSGLHPITDPTLGARNARWSPDERQIAFSGVSAETGFAALYLIAPDGSALRKLTEQRNEIVELAWSPDGQQIAYVTGSEMSGGTPTHNGNVWSLHAINTDGFADHEIATNVYPHSEPIWQPAGDQDPAATTAPPTATLPASGEEIALPDEVQTVASAGATIHLVTAGNLPSMTVHQAMEVVAAEFPWGNGGQWDGKPISIRAWYGVGTLTDVASERISDRPIWVLDYGNVQGIIHSRSPDDPNPLTIPNHNVYAIDVETREFWFAGSYLEAELETGPTPSPSSTYPSPTAGPPEELPLAPIVTNVESSGISISMTQSHELFAVSRQDAVSATEDVISDVDARVVVAASGLTTIVAPTWSIIDRPMHVLDVEHDGRADTNCPQGVNGMSVICHDIYAIDGISGEVLALGRSLEAGPPSGN